MAPFFSRACRACAARVVYKFTRAQIGPANDPPNFPRGLYITTGCLGRPNLVLQSKAKSCTGDTMSEERGLQSVSSGA